MCVKTMSLETSEHTPSRREVVVVGSAMIRGEDLPSQGRIYIFDIIDVVPEPDRPETSHKLKLIAEEEVKGAVTALSPIGSQGFLLVAQGQKCLVRGLKEDGSLLPVAFMDMQCYVTVAKELEGTGLCITGDAVKGIWLTGYYVQKSPFPPLGPPASPISWNANQKPLFRRSLTNCVSSANLLITSKSSRLISSPMENNSTLSSQTQTATFIFCNSIPKVYFPPFPPPQPPFLQFSSPFPPLLH